MIRTIFGLLLAALFLAGPWLGAGLLVIAVPTLRELVAAGLYSAIVFALFASPVLASAGLVSTTALAVVLGMVFPFPWAWGIGVITCIAATLVQLLAARSTLAPALGAWADRSGKARALAASFAGMTPWKTAIVFAVARLAPHVPFAATNLALGALRPHLTASVVGSGVGALVRMGVFAWAGRGVTDFDQVLEGDGLGPVWNLVTIAAGVLLLIIAGRWLVRMVGLAPMVSPERRMRDRRTDREASQDVSKDA